MEYINESELRKWYSVFKNNNELVEIRVINKSANKVFSGYFTDIETIIKALEPHQHSDIYFTLNAINEACYSRKQRDRFVVKAEATTSDSDIIGRTWALIDIDCEKPASVNSTDAEKAEAKKVAGEVYRFLLSQGFNKPVVADSCNGYHILINQQLANTADNTKLMKDFLLVLDMLFSNEHAKIDTCVHNASRISKLYSTYGRKGSNTKERPQRQSRILFVPDEITPNDIEYFKKVSALLPEPEKPTRFNNFSTENFDLDGFIQKHNIQVRNIQQTSEGRKIILDHCLFDSNHKGKDAMIFQRTNGAIGYSCFHNSCSHYKFRDVRLMFEPQAYDRKEYREFQYKRHYYSDEPKPKFEPIKENSDKGKKWLEMSDIEYVDMTKLVAIPTGYTDMDKDILGFLMGELTVLSGLSGGGKTSWLGCVALNAVQRGYKCALFSGEMLSHRLQNWLWQICAGKSNVRKKEGYNNLYYAPKAVGEKINKWMDGKFFLYNNIYGSKWGQLFNDIKECVENKNVQLLILDNLLTIDISDFDGTQYNHQTAFINEVKEYAKLKSIHIIVVAHPRKDNGLLRKESIAGTADLTHLADNVIIIHRIGKDFDTRAKEFFGAERTAELLMYDSVIELTKNRSFGYVDKLYGMFYEQETRRLKNEISEHIRYGWEDSEVASSNTLEFGTDLEPQSNSFNDDDGGGECPF